jgi:hypothetical protein
MNRDLKTPDPGLLGGVRITGDHVRARTEAASGVRDWLSAHALSAESRGCVLHDLIDGEHHFRLRPKPAAAWVPRRDTLALAQRLRIDPLNSDTDLEREILVAMLMAPDPLVFPSFEEFESAVRVRCNTVRAARKAALAFDTEAIERPADYWTYSEATGFTVRPGTDLVSALRKATQPEPTGATYTFSCYRATEYVMLLAIAQEAARAHPELHAGLQRQWERRAIQSGEFHEVFLHEYGSMTQPVPTHYYIPGDRVWFRNPDPNSADAPGYEGSWVIYLGSGQFNNFWKADAHFSFESKCIEVYHWRHGAWKDSAGQVRIDEAEVERCVASTSSDPLARSRVLACMQRLRDPRGVYDQGGCIDRTREFALPMREGTSQIQLPAH